MQLFYKILDWSEVWAALIPLAFMLLYKDKATYLKPIRIYICIIIPINLLIDLLSNLPGKLGLREGDFLWNNNVLYNIGSIVRMLFFAWFFNRLRQMFMHRVKFIIPYGFMIFVIINFMFFEKFVPMTGNETFSSRLLATESALLLFYCLQYYIYLILEDENKKIQLQRGFWVVTGLSIYVAANFFIYLFYEYLTDEKRGFASDIWNVHNLVFIILCIFISKQFHQEAKFNKDE